MSTLKKGLILALVQVLLVVAVGGKLMIDRARYPKVWVETAPYDPDLPLRGRYVRLLAVVEPTAAVFDSDVHEPTGEGFNSDVYHQRGRVEVRNNRLIMVPDEDGRIYFSKNRCGPRECLTLAEPLAFFIPESIKDPSIRGEDEQLWVRVTVPPHGAPRPIELGVKKQGKLTPLEP